MKFLAISLVLVGLGLVAFTVYPVSAQLADNDSDSKSGILVATTNNSMYDVPYSITGGVVNEIIPLCDSMSLVVGFDSDEAGKLSLDIPRNLLDPKSRDGDAKFFVILNGEEIPYDDISNKHSSEIILSFEPGPQELEIIATWDLSLGGKKISCNAVHDPPYSYILPPLKQFNSGTPYHETLCKPGLQLTQKHDKSPACVSSDTYFELIKRDWTSNIIKAVQSRDLSSDMNTALSSYMNKIIPTLDDFKNVLSESYNIDKIFSKFGEPHDDIGSGIHIYVYKLNDLTEIWIGYVDDIWYIQHVDSKGNLIEELFLKQSSELQPNAFANGVTEILNEERQPLRYYPTNQTIPDTFLGKTVKQWQEISHDKLLEEYKNYHNNEFFTDLGKILIKNEMTNQMNNLGIINHNENFEPLDVMHKDSLPPHISWSAVINATDGHHYLLQGGTHANQVIYHKTTQLQYPDESKFPRIKTTPNFSEDGTIPRITITEVGGNDLKAEPYSIILPQPGDVEFYNKTPGKLTVYLNEEGVEEFSFDTSLDISTRSDSGMAYPFDGPGVYSFHAKVPKNIDGKEYELNTGGSITVLADDMRGLPQKVQIEIAKEILMSSGLPITSLGQKGTENVIFIGLDNSIEQLLSESKQYYLKAAQSLMPFDIRVALWELQK